MQPSSPSGAAMTAGDAENRMGTSSDLVIGADPAML
jgi:hypothetical protein